MEAPCIHGKLGLDVEAWILEKRLDLRVRRLAAKKRGSTHTFSTTQLTQGASYCQVTHITMKVTAAAAVASLGMASAFVTPGAFRATTSSLNKVGAECVCDACRFDHARQLPWLDRIEHACWGRSRWQEDEEIHRNCCSLVFGAGLLFPTCFLTRNVGERHPATCPRRQAMLKGRFQTHFVCPGPPRK